jgi:hypothetical protein
MSQETFEVSERLGQMILCRILELELGASRDEKIIPSLLSHDHKRRQRNLIDAQRAEVERLRSFLSATNIREPELPRTA